jgi:uncharacterized protein with PQ loop repeat
LQRSDVAVDNPGETITWIFVTVNSARILAYLPQIHAAWRCNDGARSISMLTWSYFALAHLTGAFYCSAVTNDPKLAAVFVANCLACSALVAVVGWKRRHDALRQSSRALPNRTELPLAAISTH